MNVSNLLKRLSFTHLSSIKGIYFLKIAKYFLYAIPIIFVSYLYLLTNKQNQSFLESIEQNPFITILFLIAMIQPFCSLVLQVGIAALEEKKTALIYPSFMLLAAAELLVGNIIACILITAGTYLYRKHYVKNIASNRSRRNLLVIILAALIFLLSIICTGAFFKLSGY